MHLKAEQKGRKGRKRNTDVWILEKEFEDCDRSIHVWFFLVTMFFIIFRFVILAVFLSCTYTHTRRVEDVMFLLFNSSFASGLRDAVNKFEFSNVKKNIFHIFF